MDVNGFTFHFFLLFLCLWLSLLTKGERLGGVVILSQTCMVHNVLANEVWDELKLCFMTYILLTLWSYKNGKTNCYFLELNLCFLFWYMRSLKYALVKCHFLVLQKCSSHCFCYLPTPSLTIHIIPRSTLIKCATCDALVCEALHWVVSIGHLCSRIGLQHQSFLNTICLPALLKLVNPGSLCSLASLPWVLGSCMICLGLVGNISILYNEWHPWILPSCNPDGDMWKCTKVHR